MPDISIEIEVWCSCGNGLCNKSHGDTKYGRPCIIVEPCERCIDNAYDKGLAEGQE